VSEEVDLQHQRQTGQTYSRPIVERCVKYAYELTRKRDNKKKILTLVHKCNVLTHAGDLWVRVHKELGDKFYPSSPGRRVSSESARER
jgi:isocitrate/isopropylmalate dehydrogenase